MREQWIVSDPGVMMGKSVVAGTRITVVPILEKLAAGETIEQILDEYPRLTREAVQADLAVAGEALRADVSRLPGAFAVLTTKSLRIRRLE